NSILRCPSISDGRLSYQFSSDGYIRRSVYAYQELLKAGKYYEANLVLKGAEEGIVVDSEMLVAGN
ncbi:YfdX family protein, partial [Klebsiella pneumoniae]